MSVRVAAVVLAAGRGSRFSSANGQATKVAAPFRGVPLVRTVATIALDSGARPVVVVTGPASGEVDAALRGLAVRIAHNAAYATGMAGSLRAGLAAVPDDADGALVLLADMPLVQARTLDRLVARFDARGGACDAVVPVHDGRCGNPVLISRRLFASVQTLQGDEGARGLLARPGVLIDRCEVDDRGVTIDVDTQADLATLDRIDRSGG